MNTSGLREASAILAIDIQRTSSVVSVFSINEPGVPTMNMTEQQTELLSQTVADVVREAMSSRTPPTDEGVQRIALGTVAALKLAFARINAAD